MRKETSMTTATLSQPRPGIGNRKVVFGVVAILAAIGLLIVVSLQPGSVYYLTVSEARTQLRPGGTEIVRVNGVADQSSVKWDAQSLNMSFDITEGDKRLPVHFHGVMPDTFAQSESVVVEGALGANGVFEARTMLVKCPSRYEPVIAPSS
jgi:cytochrome c-type biogenesis protein CcmE